MFERLRRWAGRGDIEILGYDEGVLTFRTWQRLAPGGTVPLGVALEDGTREIVTLALQSREGDVCTAQVLGSPEALRRLHGLHGAERRGQRRQARKLRVRSPDLPGFEAVTEDLSGAGGRLVVEAEVPPGRELRLDVHFDEPENQVLALRGTVVWCRPRDARTWWAGVRFLA